MELEHKDVLVIPDRPQITVSGNPTTGMIEITTAGIADGFEHVRIDTVYIPPDCAKQVAEAILKLAE